MIYQNISQNITKYMKIAYNLKRPWKVEFCSCHSEKYFARLILGSRSPSLTHIVENASCTPKSSGQSSFSLLKMIKTATKQASPYFQTQPFESLPHKTCIFCSGSSDSKRCSLNRRSLAQIWLLQTLESEKRNGHL